MIVAKAYGFSGADVDRIRAVVDAVENQPTDLRRGRSAATVPPIGRVIRLRVKSVGDDYLVCRRYDGTEEDNTDLNVAKPWLLRRSTGRTGYTYSYTSNVLRVSTKTDDSSTENQVVTPSWMVDDEIYAVLADSGVLVSGESVRYVDLNLDGRQWSKVTS